LIHQKTPYNNSSAQDAYTDAVQDRSYTADLPGSQLVVTASFFDAPQMCLAPLAVVVPPFHTTEIAHPVISHLETHPQRVGTDVRVFSVES
jgi:hypothetical protein